MQKLAWFTNCSSGVTTRTGRIGSKADNSFFRFRLLELNRLAECRQCQLEYGVLFVDPFFKPFQSLRKMCCTIERFEIRNRRVMRDEFLFNFGYRPSTLVMDSVQRKVKTPACCNFQTAHLLRLVHACLAIRSEFAEE